MRSRSALPSEVLGSPSSSTPGATTPVSTAAMVAALKLMNYYPEQNPWNGMWYQWQPGAIDADMARIAAIGANTVRIIVQPYTFGYPRPTADYLSRLRDMIGMASSHGLRTQLTLFDGWSAYGDLDGSRTWAAAMLAPFRGDPRIAFIELQNEVRPSDGSQMSWVREMLPAVRGYSELPVTVSVFGWNTARPLADLQTALGTAQPDLYDLHFYGTPSYMPSTFQSAKQIAGAQPLVIGETGYSTDPANDSIPGVAPTVAAHEEMQANYLAAVEQAAHAAGLPPAAPWILSDFAASTGLSPSEQHFGLYRLDGSPKPAVGVVHDAFSS